MCVGTVVLLPVGVAGAGAALLDPKFLMVGFAIAVLSSAIPYSIEMAALRRLPARVFGVLMSLDPAVPLQQQVRSQKLKTDTYEPCQAARSIPIDPSGVRVVSNDLVITNVSPIISADSSYVSRIQEGDRRDSNPRPPEPQSADIGFWALLGVAETA
jgi:hypothetical protein